MGFEGNNLEAMIDLENKREDQARFKFETLGKSNPFKAQIIEAAAEVT